MTVDDPRRGTRRQASLCSKRAFPETAQPLNQPTLVVVAQVIEHVYSEPIVTSFIAFTILIKREIGFWSPNQSFNLARW